MIIEEILFETYVRLGAAEIPLQSYSELQIGDILLLKQKEGEPFEVMVADEKRFDGIIGLYGTRKAVKVI